MTAPHPSTLLRIEPAIRSAATPAGTPRVRRASDRQQAAAHVDPFADIKTAVHRSVIDLLGPRLLRRDGTRHEGADSDNAIAAAIAEALTQVDRPLSHREREQIAREVTADVVGYGPIDQYLHDEDVTEVMVNAWDQVWIERDGKLVETNTRFVDDAHVERIIARIVSEVGRRIDESSPMVDARLPDGSRVNAIIPPLALNGPCLTIRKFRTDRFQMADLVAMGTLSERAAQFLELCVRGIPTMLLLKIGEAIAQKVGAAPRSQIQQWLEGELACSGSRQVG
jgi:pilus assembly protein CpaF